MPSTLTPELKYEIIELIDNRIQERHVTREDFSELKNIVRDLALRTEELAEAQRGSERRITRLETAVEELAEAEKRSEERLTRVEAAVEKLAEAQRQTEVRVEELAEAQKRTEEAVKELAEAQKRTEKSISDQITALGGRWGIYNEATFRATIKGILSKQEGMEVKSGYYAEREVDVIIRNGEHIILEITSRLKSNDVDNLMASADDYKKKHGVEPVLMVATSYISPRLMQRILGLPKKIEVFSYEGGDD